MPVWVHHVERGWCLEARGFRVRKGSRGWDLVALGPCGRARPLSSFADRRDAEGALACIAEFLEQGRPVLHWPEPPSGLRGLLSAPGAGA